MGKAKLEKKWDHLSDYIEDDLKELNVKKNKIKKIKDKFVSAFEIAYWNAMVNVLEEWT